MSEYTIKISFATNDLKERDVVSWHLLDNEPAKAWKNQFIKTCFLGDVGTYRYTGLNTNEGVMKSLGRRLNECIEIINETKKYYIKERFTGTFNQEFSNIIHHHFEILSDHKLCPEVFKVQINTKLFNAVSNLNFIIHDMEAYDRNLHNRSTSSSAIITTYMGREALPFPKSFMNFFSYKISPGDIFLNYAQIGKTWLEVMLDNDKEVFPDAIRPHQFYNAGFDIHIFDSLKSHQSTLREVKNFISQRGGDPEAPENGLGYIQIAKLEMQNLTLIELKNYFEKYSQMIDVKLYLKNKLICKSEVTPVYKELGNTRK